jgi:3-isopropylmalate/(R)-2-methylmalate dehydratase large subunit
MSRKKVLYLSHSGTAADLLDNITTDDMTRIRDVLLLKPEELKASFLKGLQGWSRSDVSGDILVAGESFGIGSSRENAAEAVKLNGFEVVLSKSFGPIFKENLINQGVFPTTHFHLLQALEAGEEVRFDELTAGLSFIQKRILSSGGLPGYIKAVSEGKEDLPQDLLPDRIDVAQTSIEKLVTRFSQKTHVGLKDRSKTVKLQQGDSAILQADYLVGYDVFFAHTLRILSTYFDERTTFDLKNLYLFTDHFGGSDSVHAQEAVKLLTTFWKEHLEVTLGTDGVYNKVMPRKLKPDRLTMGMDSHTPELGIVPGLLAVPIGYTAFACGLAREGLVPLTVPPSIKLEFEGELPGYCEIKDALWTLVKEYFSGSLGNGKVFEIGGPGYQQLGFEEAAKIFNTVTEFGGIGAIGVDPNPQVIDYLRRHGSGLTALSDSEITDIFQVTQPDEGAHYEAIIRFDLNDSKPCIAGPDSHKVIRFIQDMETSEHFDRVIYNSCAGSSILDLAVLATLLSSESRTIPIDIHLADPLTRIQAKELGLFYELQQSGVNIDLTHSCGPCMGQGAAVKKGEKVLSTNNRNYPGRMGHAQATVFLASGVVAALTGKLGRSPTLAEVKMAEPLVYQAREKVHSLTQLN